MRASTLISTLSIAVLGLLSASLVSAAETDYLPGHQALQLWNDEAKNNVPPAIALWLTAMKVTFLTGLVFVWKHVAARWVVGGVLLSIASSSMIAQTLGLTLLSGFVSAMHLVFWSPGLFFLIKHRPYMKGLSLYGCWAAIATMVIVTSFIFDIRDAAIYLDHLRTR